MYIFLLASLFGFIGSFWLMERFSWRLLSLVGGAVTPFTLTVAKYFNFPMLVLFVSLTQSQSFEMTWFDGNFVNHLSTFLLALNMMLHILNYKAGRTPNPIECLLKLTSLKSRRTTHQIHITLVLPTVNGEFTFITIFLRSAVNSQETTLLSVVTLFPSLCSSVLRGN